MRKVQNSDRSARIWGMDRGDRETFSIEIGNLLRIKIPGDPESIVGLALVLLSASAAVVAVIIAWGMAAGQVTAGIGATLIGGLVGANVLLEMANILLRRKRQD